MAISNKQEFLIDKQIKELVILFLETNASDIDLSTKTGISPSTVGRRLIDEKRIMRVFNKEENKIPSLLNENSNLSYGEYIANLVKERRKDNLLKARSKGGKTTYQKFGYAKSEDAKFKKPTYAYGSNIIIDLNRFYHDPNKQIKFLINCILTFRLNLDTISNILNIPQNEIYDKLIKVSPNLKDSLDYLFSYEYSEQSKARLNFLNFIERLTQALDKKNKEQIQELLLVINDDTFLNVRKKILQKSLGIKENINVLLNYQLKYSLSNYHIAHIINIEPNRYTSFIHEYLLDKPKLYDKVEALNDYWHSRRKIL